MRVVLTLVAALIAADMATAEVRLAVKKDGTKVIYNTARRNSSRGADYTWLARQHDRRTKYDPIIERHAARHGVDPTLVRAVIQVESGFDPTSVSHKGARGLMQLMPATARRFGVKSIHDPDQNIAGGVEYLSLLLRMFNGDLHRALAAYNAGENAVIRYGGIPPYSETREYVRRALTVYYGRPYSAPTTFAARRGGKKLRGGFDPVQPVAAALIPGARILGQH
jgi:soluble lytic murein transglycosylase-like protein